MIFEKQFNTLIERLENSLACILMGFDGISVLSKGKPGIDLDLELMGAEISAFVNQLRHAAFIDQFGEAKELVLHCKDTTILLHILTKDYFLALVMLPEAHVGKGRFLLKIMEDEIVSELG